MKENKKNEELKTICIYNKIKGIIKVIAFFLILLICLEIVYNVTKRKYAYQKTADFFAQEEDFDVLFFGSSHVLNGIYPMELWEDYGIVSYNMGNHGERIVVSYYNMLLALQETKPQLIVIDAYMASYDSRYQASNIEYLHNTLDAYPISYRKYLAIKDIFYDEFSIDQLFEFLFNFSMYHARWIELEKSDFTTIGKYEKGAETKTVIATPQPMSEFDSVETDELKETVNTEYLRKMIEYCQENEIEILVINLPNQAKDKDIAYSKYVQTICDEYNVNYINFLDNMDVININIDYYDSRTEGNSHLNASGARKVTDYLGQYIMENYDIQDQRENVNYSFWYEDYDEYIDLKIDNLEANKKTLNNYLMLLYDEEDIGYEITISSELEIEEESTLQYLLENLNNNYTIDDEVFAEEDGKTIKITTWDNRTGEEIDTVWF